MKILGTLVLLLIGHSFAAAQIWVDGVIGDSACGRNHGSTKNVLGNGHMPDAECVRECVKERNAKYVFLARGKTYPIANQDAAGLEESAGLHVLITGHLNNGGITIASINWRGPPLTRFFAGALERLSPESITIHQADGVLIDSLIPQTGDLSAEVIAAGFHLGDHVVISCEPVQPPVLEARRGRYQFQELKKIRRLRAASPDEIHQLVSSNRSWSFSTNLLKRSIETMRFEERPPAPPQLMSAPEQAALDHARTVNLNYLANMRDFVADEIEMTYTSPRAAQPPKWNLLYTFESEITTRHGYEHRTNVRKDGKVWTAQFLGSRTQGAGFDSSISQVFSPSCPNIFEFAGHKEFHGKHLIAYRISAPAGGCFTNGAGYETYLPAIQGQILIDDPGGRLIQFEYEASAFPEEFFLAYYTWEATWDDVKIDNASYLLPVGSELASVDSTARNQVTRVVKEYKNHRHFEASSNMTFP